MSSKKTSTKSRSASRARQSGKKAQSKAPARDEPKRSLLPNDVLKAIQRARKKNPKDKYGDGAFRINVARTRAFQNKNDKKRKATYIPFEIHHNGEWIGVNIRVMNVKTEAGVKEPEEREYGISLTFRQSSSFLQKTGDG